MDPQDLAALRTSPVLSHVSAPNLERMLQIAEPIVVQQGQALFQAGDLATKLYLLRRGTVQILRPDASNSQGPPRVQAHVRAGEVLCDVGLFTGIRHRSTARVAETVEALCISWHQLKNLFRDHPNLAHQICSALAHTLTATRTLLESTKGSSISLKGSLKGVDILSLVHTLASCEELSGRIVIYDDRQTTLGAVIVAHGGIVGATFGRSVGMDGFYELILTAPENGGFCFEESQDQMAKGEAVEMPGASLVLEAHRLRDELARFRKEYGLPGTRIVPAEGQLTWEGKDLGVVLRLWRDLQCGRPVSELLMGSTPLKELRTYTILHELVQTGQATVARG